MMTASRLYLSPLGFVLKLVTRYLTLVTCYIHTVELFAVLSVVLLLLKNAGNWLSLAMSTSRRFQSELLQTLKKVSFQ